MKIKSFWYISKNVGDTLTPVILKCFVPGVEIKHVAKTRPGKWLAVGSIMAALRPGDTVWGAGVMRETDKFPAAPKCKFLAVRGKLSAEILRKNGGIVPEVYGDPALLLPLIYNPDVKKEYDIGIIPHYIDRHLILSGNRLAEIAGGRDALYIDVFTPWREFVKKVLSCRRVISSSLHGIIIAEAYGIPAEWVEWSDKVIGQGFKFRDHLSGTDREARGPGEFPPIPDLKKIQNNLLNALYDETGGTKSL